MPTASASEGRALVERERFPEGLSPTVCKAAGSSARAPGGSFYPRRATSDVPAVRLDRS
jgi:hypothetical protein